MTSRNPYSWTTCLELNPFSVEEATEYLIRITERDPNPDQYDAAVSIAKRLGGLPLAVAQMSSIITHQNLSFTDFLKSYEKRGDRTDLLQWDVALQPQLSNYEHNVASVWAFDSLGKSALSLLSILSMLAPDDIPELLFWPETSDEMDADLDELRQTYKSARNELLARSLVTRNKRTGRLFVHRLVQDVIRHKMNAVQSRKVFFICVSLLSSRWRFVPFTWRHSIDRWGTCEKLAPHVERLKQFYPELCTSPKSFDSYEFAKLLLDTGW